MVGWEGDRMASKEQDRGKWLRRFHLGMVGVWALLAVPTILWWKESILWVATMSLYANMGAHFSAYQGSRAEEEAGGQDG